MARRFLDDDLMTWEAYASSGDYGFARPGRLMLHCLSDPAVRARYLKGIGDRAAVERVVETASLEQFRELLKKSEPLS